MPGDKDREDGGINAGDLGLDDGAISELEQGLKEGDKRRESQAVMQPWLNKGKDEKVWTKEDIERLPRFPREILSATIDCGSPDRDAPLDELVKYKSHFKTKTDLIEALKQGRQVQTSDYEEAVLELGVEGIKLDYAFGLEKEMRLEKEGNKIIIPVRKSIEFEDHPFYETLQQNVKEASRTLHKQGISQVFREGEVVTLEELIKKVSEFTRFSNHEELMAKDNQELAQTLWAVRQYQDHLLGKVDQSGIITARKSIRDWETWLSGLNPSNPNGLNEQIELAKSYFAYAKDQLDRTDQVSFDGLVDAVEDGLTTSGFGRNLTFEQLCTFPREKLAGMIEDISSRVDAARKSVNEPKLQKTEAVLGKLLGSGLSYKLGNVSCSLDYTKIRKSGRDVSAYLDIYQEIQKLSNFAQELVEQRTIRKRSYESEFDLKREYAYFPVLDEILKREVVKRFQPLIGRINESNLEMYNRGVEARKRLSKVQRKKDKRGNFKLWVYNKDRWAREEEEVKKEILACQNELVKLKNVDGRLEEDPEGKFRMDKGAWEEYKKLRGEFSRELERYVDGVHVDVVHEFYSKNDKFANVFGGCKEQLIDSMEYHVSRVDRLVADFLEKHGLRGFREDQCPEELIVSIPPNHDGADRVFLRKGEPCLVIAETYSGKSLEGRNVDIDYIPLPEYKKGEEGGNKGDFDPEKEKANQDKAYAKERKMPAIAIGSIALTSFILGATITGAYLGLRGRVDKEALKSKIESVKQSTTSSLKKGYDSLVGRISQPDSVVIPDTQSLEEVVAADSYHGITAETPAEEVKDTIYSLLMNYTDSSKADITAILSIRPDIGSIPKKVLSRAVKESDNYGLIDEFGFTADDHLKMVAESMNAGKDADLKFAGELIKKFNVDVNKIGCNALARYLDRFGPNDSFWENIGKRINLERMRDSGCIGADDYDYYRNDYQVRYLK